MILGITGGTGCGKTTLLNIIRERGGLVLDCDEIYHRLLESDAQMLGALKLRFPGAFPGGCFVRRELGKIVFADPKALADLNAITHAAVTREVVRRLDPSPALAAIDAIALFESGISEDCVFTVGVTAPDDERCARIMARDGIDVDYALARIEAQPDDEYYEMRCDYLLRNDGTPEELKAKCRELFGIG